MLTLVEIQEALTRFTYRPGWTFTAYEGAAEGVHIQIKAEVRNAYVPDESVVLDIRSALPPMRSVGDLAEWLLWRMRRVEDHEAREWFRFDGKPVSDPHEIPADRTREEAEHLRVLQRPPYLVTRWMETSVETGLAQIGGA